MQKSAERSGLLRKGGSQDLPPFLHDKEKRGGLPLQKEIFRSDAQANFKKDEYTISVYLIRLIKKEKIWLGCEARPYSLSSVFTHISGSSNLTTQIPRSGGFAIRPLRI